MLGIVDTGATHNFIYEKMVQSFGINIAQSMSRIKTVNSAAQSVYGMATDVGIQVRNWSGHVNLMVILLDDFDAILGNELFRAAKVSLMPYLDGLLISDVRTPCFVTGCNKPGGRQVLCRRFKFKMA